MTGRTSEALRAWREALGIDSLDSIDRMSEMELMRPGLCDVLFVCLKWGSKYGPEYVNRLGAALGRHHPMSHHEHGVSPSLERQRRCAFVCVTECAEGLETGVVSQVLALKDLDSSDSEERPSAEWRGWWHKSSLFSSAARTLFTRVARASGLREDCRVVFLDLDVVVTAPLDSLIAQDLCPGQLAVLRSDELVSEGLRCGGVNSSWMMWSLRDAALLERVVTELRKPVFALMHRFDHWLEVVLGDDQLNRIACGAGSPVNDLRGVEEPADSVIPPLVIFPLTPKPHELHRCDRRRGAQIVVEHWIANGP